MVKKIDTDYLPFLSAILIVFTLLLTAGKSFGQQKHLNASEIDVKFSQVLTKSEQVRKSYTWSAKTEVFRKGDLVNTLIEKYGYDNNGKEVVQVIRDDQAELPSTPLIRQIAEAAKNRMVGFMERLRDFLETYALAEDSLRHHFFDSASIGIPDKNGFLQVKGSNVITPGDELIWWINTNTYSISKVTISTDFEDDEVEFSASYTFLPSGINYINRAEIRVPGQDLVVKRSFYDFIFKTF